MQIIRDPRFDNLSGEYNEQFFQKAYSFIDDVKEKEKRVSTFLYFAILAFKLFYSVECSLEVVFDVDYKIN